MSTFGQINWRDIAKGAILAVLTGILQMVYQSLSANGVLDFKAIGVSAVIALCAYLLKALGTDSVGKLGGII